MTNLTESNINVLESATDRIRKDFKDDPRYIPGHASMRFYHLVLLECCDWMKPADLAWCIRQASEQMRRPE